MKHKNYSNENVGWVVELKIKKLKLYKDTAWYTMIHHQGGGAQAALARQLDPKKQPIAFAKAQHAAICAGCHSVDGTRLAGPSFKGLFGRKQKVIRDSKTVSVTVDEKYLANAIANPLGEAPVGYPPAMPALSLAPAERMAIVQWIKTLK